MCRVECSFVFNGLSRAEFVTTCHGALLFFGGAMFVGETDDTGGWLAEDS